MAMDDRKIALLQQRTLYRGFDWLDSSEEYLAEATQERFTRFYAGMRDRGAVDYDLDRMATAIFYLRALLTRKGLTGPNMTAVEVGSGTGTKSLSLSGLFGTYIGIEINDDQVRQADERNRIFGSRNTRFISANAADVLRNCAAYDVPDKIDVLILYAVLEHMTREERQIVIALADDVMTHGGSVLVMESPNRLIPFDSHTTGMQFFNWLPDDLASHLARAGATNPNIRESLLPWEDPNASIALARAGRGVSHHDFADTLPHPLQTYSFDLDGFDVEMLNMEPFNYQEFALLGYLSANVPDLPAASFSRSWLDFLVSHQGRKSPERRFLSPFWPKWASFDHPPRFWDPVAVTLTVNQPAWLCEMPKTQIRDVTLIFVAPENDGHLTLYIDDLAVEEIDIPNLISAKPSTWHQGHSVTVYLGREVATLRVEADPGRGQILFQGCMASIIAPDT
jgi:ubiquinone/menaquinone biosynthesis C-methylase UbiE